MFLRAPRSMRRAVGRWRGRVVRRRSVAQGRYRGCSRELVPWRCCLQGALTLSPTDPACSHRRCFVLRQHQDEQIGGGADEDAGNGSADEDKSARYQPARLQNRAADSDHSIGPSDGLLGAVAARPQLATLAASGRRRRSPLRNAERAGNAGGEGSSQYQEATRALNCPPPPPKIRLPMGNPSTGRPVGGRPGFSRATRGCWRGAWRRIRGRRCGSRGRRAARRSCSGRCAARSAR